MPDEFVGWMNAVELYECLRKAPHVDERESELVQHRPVVDRQQQEIR